MPTSSVHWGRVALGGFLAEALLVVLVIPVQLAGGGDRAITAVAVAGSFFVFVPIARWLTRSLDRQVLHGALMGVAAAAMYILLSVVGRFFIPDAPPVPLIYYFAHLLKVAGGATGGWLARRTTAIVT